MTFSGQPLYEPLIYQAYNPVFTAVALFYWGIFDFQYEKRVFLANP